MKTTKSGYMEMICQTMTIQMYRWPWICKPNLCRITGTNSSLVEILKALEPQLRGSFGNQDLGHLLPLVWIHRGIAHSNIIKGIVEKRSNEPFEASWGLYGKRSKHLYLREIASRQQKIFASVWHPWKKVLSGQMSGILTNHTEILYLLRSRKRDIRLLEVTVKNNGQDVNETWYMFNLEKERRKHSWLFTVTMAEHALMVCRLDSSYSDVDLVKYFLDRGMPFQTMKLASNVKGSLECARSSSTTVCRSANYRFLIDDFDTFEERCFYFVEKNERGRMAAMIGGVPWRLSVDKLDWQQDILYGPCGWSPNSQEYILGLDRKTNDEYIDDALTDTEQQQLCGMYFVSAGQ